MKAGDARKVEKNVQKPLNKPKNLKQRNYTTKNYFRNIANLFIFTKVVVMVPIKPSYGVILPFSCTCNTHHCGSLLQTNLLIKRLFLLLRDLNVSSGKIAIELPEVTV